MLGRIDDVMNVSGHRISTAEVESALVGHAGVAEAAVVGATDDTTGQAICAFVILCASYEAHDGTIPTSCATQVAQEISPIAKPREIHVVPELPKTRSGKIMRRLLRDVAEEPRTRRHLYAGRSQRVRGDPGRQVSHQAGVPGRNPNPAGSWR